MNTRKIPVKHEGPAPKGEVVLSNLPRFVADKSDQSTQRVDQFIDTLVERNRSNNRDPRR
jgi:hypothetical protein